MIAYRSFVHTLYFFLFLVSSSLYPQGFLANTVVWSNNEYVPIEELQHHDEVIAYTFRNSYAPRAITHIKKEQIPWYVKISFADELLCVAPDQKFFIPEQKKWIEAQKLQTGDILFQDSDRLVRVDYIEYVHQPVAVYDITVTDYHTFCVSKQNLIAHNFLPGITIGLSWAIGEGITFAGMSVGISIFGIGLSLLFKDKHKRPEINIRPGNNNQIHLGSNQDPENDKDKEKNDHLHGVYKGAKYHKKGDEVKTGGKGQKSSAPRNGQKALDNSVEVAGSSHRIAIEDDKIVILRKTSKGEYHGYIENWNNLSKEARRALKDAGWVIGDGKII